jgi:NADPH:quinone reductase-like Zn-dependent oxidoreductase
VGAKYVIATEEEDFVKEINAITGGQGARVVFDPVGGPTLLELIKAMSFQGILYLYGALSDQATTVPPRPDREDPDDKRAQHQGHQRKSGTAEGGSRFRDQRFGEGQA